MPVRKATSDDSQPKEVIIEHKTLWSNPSPNSVYIIVHGAMKEADDGLYAKAFKELAKAEANDTRATFTYQDVIDWLEQHKANADWIIHHIQHDLDLQRDIPALLPEKRRAKCEHCGRWYVKGRSDQRFCKRSHAVMANKKRKRQN
jgi:hypothetical protein